MIAFDSEAIDPIQVRRFMALEKAMGAPPSNILHEGDQVPDFMLTDQNFEKVKLSQFQGKTVAINFIYTRCPLPRILLSINE